MTFCRARAKAVGSRQEANIRARRRTRSTTDNRPHSAAYFGPERDFWWNVDHLRLIAARRSLSEVRTVLDVGAGVGHWGTLLASVLPAASVTGVEREPEWVREATSRAERLGLADRCSYREGVAEALPFADASFDLATCQTVLIHVADPQAVIGEMLRVTRPGGQLIAAEPNNIASTLVSSNQSTGADIADLLDDVRFTLLCERAAMFPPYALPEQQADATTSRRRHDSATGDTRATRRCATSPRAGGDGAAFDAAWQRQAAEARCVVDAIDAGTYHAALGSLHYLVAGRRPA